MARVDEAATEDPPESDEPAKACASGHKEIQEAEQEQAPTAAAAVAATQPDRGPPHVVPPPSLAGPFVPGELISGRYLQYFGFTSSLSNIKAMGDAKHRPAAAAGGVELQVESLVAGPLAFKEVTEFKQQQVEINNWNDERFREATRVSKQLRSAIEALEKRFELWKREQKTTFSELRVNMDQRERTVDASLEDLNYMHDRIVQETLPKLHAELSGASSRALELARASIEEQFSSTSSRCDDIEHRIEEAAQSAAEDLRRLAKRTADELAQASNQLKEQEESQSRLAKEVGRLGKASEHDRQSWTAQLSALADKVDTVTAEQKKRLEKLHSQLGHRLDGVVTTLEEQEARREGLAVELQREIDRLIGDAGSFRDEFEQRLSEDRVHFMKEVEKMHAALMRKVAAEAEQLGSRIDNSAQESLATTTGLSTALREAESRLDEVLEGVQGSLADAEFRVTSLEEFQRKLEAAESPAFVSEEFLAAKLLELREEQQAKLERTEDRTEARCNAVHQRAHSISSEIALVQEQALVNVEQAKSATREQLQGIKDSVENVTSKFELLEDLCQDCGMYLENMEELMSLLEVRLGWKPGSWPVKRPRWLAFRRGLTSGVEAGEEAGEAEETGEGRPRKGAASSRPSSPAPRSRSKAASPSRTGRPPDSQPEAALPQASARRRNRSLEPLPADEQRQAVAAGRLRPSTALAVRRPHPTANSRQQVLEAESGQQQKARIRPHTSRPTSSLGHREVVQAAVLKLARADLRRPISARA